MAEIEKKPPAAAMQPSAPETPPPAAPMRIVMAAGIVGGVLLLGVVPVLCLGVAWLFSGSDLKNDPAKEVAAQPIDEPALPAVEPKPSADPKEPAMSPQVREAVDKGAAHLKKRLLEKSGPYSIDRRYPNDAPVGAIALAGLALLEAKVPPDDPAIQHALTTVREAAPKLQLVYALGAALFFLNRVHDFQPLSDADRAMVRTLALRVAAGQLANGRWYYLNPPITPQAEEELLKGLRANTHKPQRIHAQGSNSMTQFALLALWTSSRHDIPIRSAVFASADRFHQTQHPNGAWDYTGANNQRIDSNTCAGLIALAMEKTLREDQKYRHAANNDPPPHPQADEQCAKAFAHLATVIGRTKDGPAPKKRAELGGVIKADAWGDYYFLWCLERVAVIYDLKEIGGKDWYGWGSQVILQHQRPDGSWLDRHGDLCDTCFALLFLTRANLAKDLTESIRTRGGQQIVVP